MIGALTAISKVVGEGMSRWLSNRRARQDKKAEVKLAKLDVQKADLENQSRLLRDEQKANTTWETEQIKRADRWARRFLLVSLWFPFYAWWIDPVRAANYFKFVAEAPLWYTGICTSVTGAVFGLRKLLQWKQYRKETAPQQ